jgi:membrane-bound serine protease (ClpP class)
MEMMKGTDYGNNGRGRMWQILLLLMVAAGMVFFLPGSGAVAGDQPRKVYVIPVAGEVEPAMAAYIDRAFRDTAESSEALFVLEIDTFGGRVDAALQIVDTLINAAPRRTVAFVANKAISAGALIALASNDLVMRPNTTIGDCAPITYSQEGPKVMGEKFQSPLRAKFRTLARRNNYPPTLAESMVTAEMEVYRVEMEGKTFYLDSQEIDNLLPEEQEKITSRKLVVAKGELLTMDDAEAIELGFSRMTAANIEEMLAGFGIEDYQIIRLEQNWSETLGRLIARFAPILLMIGLGALYTELKAPGFGVFGIIGIVCLGLVFLNQYLVGLADYTDLLFIILGVVLLAVEFLVLPGFGLAGAAGFACIAVGMVLSFQDFVVPDPQLPWQKEILTGNLIRVLGSFAAAMVVSLLLLRYVLPRLGIVIEGPYLAATLADSHAESEEAKGVHAGDRGTARTFLRPSGKVEIGREIIDVVTEGDFIEKGTPVVVSEIKGNRIIVRKAET